MQVKCYKDHLWRIVRAQTIGNFVYERKLAAVASSIGVVMTVQNNYFLDYLGASNTLFIHRQNYG